MSLNKTNTNMEAGMPSFSSAFSLAFSSFVGPSKESMLFSKKQFKHLLKRYKLIDEPFCRPQSDHAERSDLAKRFFIAGQARSERHGGERERERERERESQESKREKGRGLNIPQ
jgi:hypothetical protein